jgi:multidrug efflux pump
MEQAVAQVNGIDYMTSSSETSVSTITINLALNYDPDKALTEISAKVNSVLNQLPQGTQQPVLDLQIGQTLAAMYISFDSTTLSGNQLTDYVERVVQPQLQAVPGVQEAQLIGDQDYAMRVWLKPLKLASYGLTPTDVWNALAANDFISPIGNTKGQMTQVTLTADTDLHSADEFRDLIIKEQNGAIIRLQDVADVELGSDDYDQNVTSSNHNTVFIAILAAPAANLLDVVAGVRKIFPGIQANVPHGMTAGIGFDATEFVHASINEVLQALAEALLIVTFVVFAFLGSPRSVLIPVVAIPLSLVGTFAIMALFGFSINLLTLLALVLAIGLVVDDAIIVVENVNRHLDLGETPLVAARAAAAELGGPIIAMTAVLIAVYLPIGFQTGLTGALFTEFAFTLAGAVTISALIALTLTPMLSSRFLNHIDREGPGAEAWLVSFIDARMGEVYRLYTRLLRSSLETVPVTLTFATIVLVSIFFLAVGASKELAPDEDQGVMFAFATSSPDSTFTQKAMWDHELSAMLLKEPDLQLTFHIDTADFDLTGEVLKPWGQRKHNAAYYMTMFQNEANKDIAGQQVVFAQPPPLPGSQGLPIEFVIKSTDTVEQIYPVAQALLEAGLKSGKFIFLQSDLKIDQPQANIIIDRDKAADLGLNMSQIGAALAQALGGNYVNYFSIDGRSYKVIPQVQRADRLNYSDLNNYYVTSTNGISVPLSAVATIQTSVIPESINHFQQQNSATIQGVPAPGVSQATALAALQDAAKGILGPSDHVDYGGPLRQYVQTSSGFIFTFVFALVIIFLALSALFNSFRDPLIILVSVPMSIAGALIFIYIGIGGLSLNIYTEVGLVTLMGLISKHGILMTEVANEARLAGMEKRAAIEHAASIRLRPILMTTAAMVLGVVPLIIASGAGAAARYAMGMVIAGGLSIGTLFTLFVVPAVYLTLSSEKHAEPKDAPTASV